MKDTYKLKINCDKSQIRNIEELLKKPSTNSESLFWEWCIDDDSRPTDAFDKYLNLLEGKYDDLKKINIDRESISIWRYYMYDQECSLEISPETMIKMGQEGVVLCISCWQDHQYTSSSLDNGSRFKANRYSGSDPDKVNLDG